MREYQHQRPLPAVENARNPVSDLSAVASSFSRLQRRAVFVIVAG